MRFSSNTPPQLTPLGLRLLSLSERKLARLEPDVGGRDEPANFHKGVVVRQAIKSAWKSIDSGEKIEISNWRSATAMGLDVIGEDEEEEEDEGEQQERWFEDLVSSFGEDGDDYDRHQYETSSSTSPLQAAERDGHEWVESDVSGPAGIDFEELEYESTMEFEAFTLPSPSSPEYGHGFARLALPGSPPSPASPTSSISSIESSFDSSMMISSTSSAATSVDIVEVEVEDELDYMVEVQDSPQSRHRHQHQLDPSSDATFPGPASTRASPPAHPFRNRDHHQPLTPIIFASRSPSSSPFASPSFGNPDEGQLEHVMNDIDYSNDDIDELDEDVLALPPLLHRCLSGGSVSSLEADADECVTPLWGSNELEVEVESEIDGGVMEEYRVVRPEEWLTTGVVTTWEEGEQATTKTKRPKQRRFAALGLDLGFE